MHNNSSTAPQPWKRSLDLKRYALLLAAAWTLGVGVLLTWNYFHERDAARQAASVAARAQFTKDVIYRRWNARHGGVYVPISESIQPNPYLTDVEEREIETPSGRRLTLINPAYMTRLVHELGLEAEGVRGHITSLDPIRPANAPDAWEKRALERFEQGAQEFASVETLDGEAYLRLMRPLTTEKACLKCHAKQGYEEGDVRGGISVSMPMAPYAAIARQHMTSLGVGHGALWLLGLVALAFGTRRIQQRVRERDRAQEALRESEERYRQLFELASDAVFLIENETERILDLNTAAEEMYGYSREQALQMRNTDFSAEPQETRQVTVNGETWVPVRQHCKQDGTVFPVEISGRHFTWRGRKVHIAAIRDITERVQAEEDRERLLVAEREQRTLAETLAEVTLALTSTLDLDQVLTTILEEVRRLMGVAACSIWLIDPESDELVCRQSAGPHSEIVRDWRLAPGEGLVGWAAQHRESLIVADATADERHFGDVDGQIGWETRSILTVPLRVRENVIGALQVVDKEIDRFREADLESIEPLASSAAIAIENARLVGGLEAEVAARTADMRAEKEKSDAILRSVGDAILMADREKRIRYVNPAFATLTGYTDKEIMDQPMCGLLAEEQPEQDAHSLQLTLEKGEDWRGDVVARRKDGRTYDAAITITPMKDDQDRLVGYVSSHRDITRQKELDRARNQFIANVSHQLRTPATNIKLYTQLLRTQVRSEKAELYVQVLEDQSNALIHLIQDILEMAELNSGQGTTRWEPISLSTIIRDALTRYQGQANASGLTLTAIPVPSDLPAVKGDQARLYQVLGELVENALTFTPAGGQVTVEAGSVEEEGQRWTTVAVRDTGPGISPEDQRWVFDRFFRGSLAASGHISGTGLGLSIAQEIVLAHSGRLTVESEVGQGSTFTFWLPSVS